MQLLGEGGIEGRSTGGEGALLQEKKKRLRGARYGAYVTARRATRSAPRKENSQRPALAFASPVPLCESETAI